MGIGTIAPEGREIRTEPDHEEGSEARVIDTIELSSENEEREEEEQSVHDEWAEDSSCSLDSLRSLGLDKERGGRLGVLKPKFLRGRRRGRGRPPNSGEIVGYAAAKREAADSILLEADARLVEDVTSKLTSTVGIFR